MRSPASLHHLHPLGAEPAPLYEREPGKRSTPPRGWATAYRAKHGEPSGMIPRSRRPLVSRVCHKPVIGDTLLAEDGQEWHMCTPMSVAVAQQLIDEGALFRYSK